MSWETVLSETYAVNPATEPLTLPYDFQPYYRLIVTADLLTGLGVREPVLGYLRQLLMIPSIGPVKGRTLALTPFQQLFIPSTELPYKLIYQPVQRDFSLKLTIQVESTIVSTEGTADNGPVLTAIAALQEQLETLPGTAEPIDYVPLFTQVLAALTTQGQAVNAISNQVASGFDGQVAIATDLADVQDQLTTLVASVNQIRTVLSLPTPTPTPTPTPPPPASPTVAGVAYTVAQSSRRLDNNFFLATYASLTDGDFSTGGVTADEGTNWLQATFPYKVTIAQITLSGGRIDGYGESDLGQNGGMLQYTVDGSTWIDFRSVSDIPGAGAPLPKTVAFNLSPAIEATGVRLFKVGVVAVPRFEFQ
ncbi:MAG: hypothetical protein KME45_27370 [Stenomitos rutilans HA7619-LM2]|jgi:hypothetical protein|nr:hypothetical protein [Stenomitos rutilans HA7619-LM2]